MNSVSLTTSKLKFQNYASFCLTISPFSFLFSYTYLTYWYWMQAINTDHLKAKEKKCFILTVLFEQYVVRMKPKHCPIKLMMNLMIATAIVAESSNIFLKNRLETQFKTIRLKHFQSLFGGYIAFKPMALETNTMNHKHQQQHSFIGLYENSNCFIVPHKFKINFQGHVPFKQLYPNSKSHYH